MPESSNNNSNTPNHSSHNKLLHHIATGFGLLFLIAYYLIIDSTGFYDWVTARMPAEYAGAGLMLGIMIAMTPGFFIWKHYNRWVEKKLGVTGKYYEDGFYKAPEQPDDNKTD
ncbi:hypothetical protein [uncultured Amphritea sp.]|uniref:hypothetical protein n=1 Tax=Amphritea sp. TaxID=1872502 RepID=UPI0025EA9CB9|nr:hypothetical protein [uncultured Amphritea sp.]